MAEQTQKEWRKNRQLESSEMLSQDKQDVWLLLQNRTKQLTIELQYDGREVLMENTIVNRVESRTQTVGETTELYLSAMFIGLKSARRLKTDFRWIFNPTDSQGKMRLWFNKMVDDFEPNNNKLRTFVPQTEVEAELAKIEKLLPQFTSKEVAVQIELISDPKKHETELRAKISRIRNNQQPKL